jgi:hypothetical protein
VTDTDRGLQIKRLRSTQVLSLLVVVASVLGYMAIIARADTFKPVSACALPEEPSAERESIVRAVEYCNRLPRGD